MDHFTYRAGALCAEDVPLAEIAAQVGTPFYVYSAATLARHFRVMDEALAPADRLICFAVKACGNLAVLRLLGSLGAGADVVSEGEMRRALAAGIAPQKIVFSGVGKTARELRAALEAGIGQFNVESEPELEALDAIARQMGVRAPIAFRVNPDVDARTHEKISTGKAENKFGVPISRAPEAYAAAARMEGVEIVGVDMHIGSQLTDLAPFEAAFSKLAALTRRLRAEGHDMRRIDLGGGLGVPYIRSNAAPPLPFDYGAVVRRTVGDLGATLVAEPGRLIAANAGLLVASTIYLKQGEDRRFLILDAGMNDLLRPAIYEAWHDIAPVAEPAPDAPLSEYDVVGPICETGDTFARARALPPLAAGDLVAFRSAGAYGATMSSEYNARPLIPEVLVSGDRFEVVRSRPTYAEMLARERIPDWLG